MIYYIFTTLMVFCSILRFQNAFNIQCRRSNNCFCTPTIEGIYEFHCSEDDPRIIVKVQPELSKLDIQCLDVVDWNDQELPSIEAGELNHLSFLQCSLPSTNFVDILNRMGVNGTKSLQFDYSPDFENTTLMDKYFEGLEGLEKLIFNSNDMVNVDGEAFQLLNNLIEIDLKFNKIILPNALFRYTPNLKLLDLSGNELSYLPTNLFDNLTELKVLSLWANKLTSINMSTFRNMHNLEFLELSRNEINHLSEDSFKDLKNLKILSLSANKLRSLADGVFQTNTLLENVYINRNPELGSLPKALFANLTKLGNLLLSDCNFTTLPNDLFEGCTHLQNLTMPMNALEILPQRVFYDLKDLRNLDLSNNQITSLPDELFLSTTEMVTLNLENNLITSIAREVLHSLRNLEVLNLKNNRINYIDIHAFKRSNRLIEIVLANNFLDLPDNGLSLFNNNLELETIDLSNNKITVIAEEFIITLIKLKKLDLSYNRISYIDYNDLLTIAFPIEINLSHNLISIINFTYAEFLARSQGNQDAYSSNSGNRVVDLNGNPLDCDCHMYHLAQYFDRSMDPMVPTLVTIKADNLKCATPVNFNGLAVSKLKPKALTCSLRQLEIDGDCPENCECAFRPWDTSYIVNCNNAKLTRAPVLSTPNGMSFNQTEVHLQRNLLVSGPDETMGYENVTKLFLSSNNISEIAWLPPKIEVLELHNNNLTAFNNSVLDMFNTTTFTNLTLGNNPWICDCSATNLISFLVSNIDRKQIDTGNIKCQNNTQLMVQLSAADICPNYLAIILGLTIGMVLPILLVTAVVAFYYRYQQEVKIWLFKHKLLLKFITKPELDKDKIYDAFISYSHEDEDFVLKKLLPVLEQGPRPYKTCIHIRDCKIGEFISRQIASSVAESRRTVVILSQNFLKSEWGIMEFRTAHQQALHENTARVILIIYGDIKVEELDQEIKAYISTNTYLKWNDPKFWDKLRFALPHAPINKYSKKSHHKNQNIMVAINEKMDKLDDKLDLINGIPTTPNLVSTPPAVTIEPLLLKTSPLNFTPPAESGLNHLLTTKQTC